MIFLLKLQDGSNGAYSLQYYGLVRGGWKLFFRLIFIPRLGVYHDLVAS